jgi:hypothetical protein
VDLGLGRSLSGNENVAAGQEGFKMMAVLRVIGSIVAGLVLAFVLVVAVEVFSGVVHPFPEDFKGTHEEVCKHVERYPDWILAVCGGMWVGAALVSTWITGWLGNRWSALFLGLLLVAMVILNVSMLPYTMWFKIGILILIPAAVGAGVYLSSRPKMVATNAPV